MSDALKDKGLQEYYDALFGMYGTPGWRMLMEDTAHMLKVHDTPRDLTSADQLWFRRGELAQMDWLATHQQRTEAAYALALEELGSDSGDIETGGTARIIDSEAASGDSSL